MSRPTLLLPRVSWFMYNLGRLLLWLGRWELVGALPADRRHLVLIAAPHTSNWDYIWMMAGASVLGARISAVGKESLERGPLGWLLRRLGLVGVDRSGGKGVVDQLAAKMVASDGMLLAIPPSGTRRYTEHWRSGFYWVAHKAGVPILMGFIDYGTRRLGVGPLLEPTGDVSADMDQIRAFYAPMRGRYPELTSKVRLRDEDR